MTGRSLCWLAFVFVAGCPGGEGGESVHCDFGERNIGGTCAAVPHMYVNLDERQDVTNDNATRSGIGVNACAFDQLNYAVIEETDGCTVLTYPQENAAHGFSANAGAIVAQLDPDPVLMLPDAEDNCYATDLHPTRRDLFSRDERIRIEGTGGPDFPAFEADVIAPHTLVMAPPSEWVAGEEFFTNWLDGAAQQMVVVAHSHDPEHDESIDIQCTIPDTGSITIPPALTDQLVGDTADLFFLRQNRVHLEPPDADVAIELLLTSSVTRSVPIVR